MKAWLFSISALLFIGCSQAMLQSGYNVQRPGSNTGPVAAQNTEAANSDSTDAGTSEEAPKTADATPAPTTNDTVEVAKPTTPVAAVPATGSVSVNLNIIPPTPAGTYRNRGHVRTVWVTDANDKYIKTIHAFAGVRAVHLKRWFTFTNNTADATSGATQTTPAAGVPIAATWDLKDKAGTVMMTGNYKLWLEYTESNTPALDQGKKSSDPAQAIDNVNGYEYLVVPFTLAPAGSTKTDSSNAVFKDVAVKHVP